MSVQQLKLEVQVDETFSSFDDWVNTAKRKIGGRDAYCIDAIGRRVRNGGDFMRAKDEKTFPVYCFWSDVKIVDPK